MAPQQQGRSSVLPTEQDTFGYKVRIYSGILAIAVTLTGLLWSAAMSFGSIKSDIFLLESRADTSEKKEEANAVLFGKMYDILLGIKEDVAEIRGEIKTMR